VEELSGKHDSRHSPAYCGSRLYNVYALLRHVMCRIAIPLSDQMIIVPYFEIAVHSCIRLFFRWFCSFARLFALSIPAPPFVPVYVSCLYVATHA